MLRADATLTITRCERFATRSDRSCDAHRSPTSARASAVRGKALSPGYDSTALALFMTHRGALVDYASGITGNREQAEDVVQEAWLRFSAATGKNRNDGKPIVQPVAYLYRIVRNLAIDLANRLNAEALHPAGEALLSHVPASNADPEQRAVHRDQLRVLVAALDELPDRTRYAFDLHRFEEKTYSQIAEILGISQARAHGLVQEALAHCMRRLVNSGKK